MTQLDGYGSKNRTQVLPYVLGALLGLSAGMAVIAAVFFFKAPARTAANSIMSGSATHTSIDDSRRNAIVAATERVAPAVISITTTRTEIVRRSPFFSPFNKDWFDRYFGSFKKKYAAFGSGVILNKDGYILTNEHVVHNADKITVTLSSGTTLEGSLVGGAREYDLALIKVESHDLPFAPLGDSDDLLVGEWVVAIGNPFGQLLSDTQPTVTVGVISARDRDVKSDSQSSQIYKGMIQTDAAINPGNSGGPLINSRGEVIGINTFIFSTGNGGNLGMGFAIPINRGKWVLDELLTYGRVRDIWTGIRVARITPEIALALNLKTSQGLLINQVEESSPAGKAGLKPGDLILVINDKRVNSVREANRIIFGSRVGDELKLEISRKNKRKKINLTLEERPSDI